MEYLKQLENDYLSYTVDCRSALRLTKARIENLREQLEVEHDRTIFDNIETRIKTFDSAVNKCIRKNYDKVPKKNFKRLKPEVITKEDFTIETIKTHMQDIAGVRITTVFQDDIYTIYNALKQQPGVFITHVDDYIIKPKKNGYRSLHLILNVEIYSRDGSKLIPVEVQIRDKAMDLWAAMDHEISYKNSNPSPEAIQKFSELARILREFDESAIVLRPLYQEKVIPFQQQNSPE